MTFAEIIELAGQAVDAFGVAVIIIGVLIATVRYGLRTLDVTRRAPGDEDGYSRYRESIGRALLLGLELLVAADIIRTVAITPTLESVAILAVIVVIRTFLSWSLEVELSGRWPWQQGRASAQPQAEQRTGKV